MKFNFNPKLIDLPPNQMLQINATIVAGAFIFLTLISGSFNADRYLDSAERYRDSLKNLQDITNLTDPKLLNVTQEIDDNIQNIVKIASWVSIFGILIPSFVAVVTIIYFSVSSLFILGGNESKGIQWMWSGFYLLTGSGVVFLGWIIVSLIQGMMELTTNR